MNKTPTLIILLIAIAGVALAAWAQSYREIPNGLQIGTADGSPGAQIESDGDAVFGDFTANGFVDAEVYKQGGVEYDLAELGGGSKHVIEDDGTPVTDRSSLNFEGPGVTLSDDAGNNATVVTIDGGGSMTDDEVEQAYNAEVPAAAQAEMETGTETGIRRMSPERVKQSVIAHAPVDSVNGQTGAASLDADDIDDTSTTQKFTSAADKSKLDGIEAGAEVNPTDEEIATAYGNEVPAASQVEMEAGTETATRRMSPQRVAQAIAAQAGSGGDPTYGSDAAASDDAVYVDENNWLGLGVTNPLSLLHIYSETSAPRVTMQYLLEGDPGDVTQYPTGAVSVDTSDIGWFNPAYVTSDNGSSTIATNFSGANNTEVLKIAFDFDIPSDADVAGVKFEVEGSMGAATHELHAYLVRNDVVDTDEDRATGANWGGSMVVTTFGGPSDDWGGVSAAEVNDPEFGLAFVGVFSSNGNISIDFVRATVYYTEASGDYLWSSGIDLDDGAYSIQADAVDLFRVDYASGDTEFTGDVTAPFFYGDGSNLENLPAPTIADGSIGRAKLASMVQDRIMGRNGSDGAPEDLTASEVRTMLNVADGAEANTVDSVNGQTDTVVLDADDIGVTGTTNKFVTAAEKTVIGNTSGTNTGDQAITLYGDLSGTWSGGGITASIVPDAVLDSMLEEVPEYTLKGRNTSGSGNPTDLSVAAVMSMLGAGYADLQVPSPLTSSTSVVISDSDRNKLLTLPLAHSTTISFGTKTQGQKILLWIYQQGGGYTNTVDWDATDFVFSADLPEPTLPTGSGNGALYSFLCVYDKYVLIAELEFNPF